MCCLKEQKWQGLRRQSYRYLLLLQPNLVGKSKGNSVTSSNDLGVSGKQGMYRIAGVCTGVNWGQDKECIRKYKISDEQNILMLRTH